MPYAKGQSGNPKGRPKQTAEQKSQKEQFQRLLKSSTVEALQSIIQIASDRYNKDRFNACKYIIDKAYGANTVKKTRTMKIGLGNRNGTMPQMKMRTMKYD